MYTLINQNFINMVRSFYPQAKIASGGKELVLRCLQCGDSKNINHAHLYIKVPQAEDEIALYHCKKCNSKGIVDDVFLRRYGCDDARVLVDIVKHNNDLKKHPKYNSLRHMSIYPLKNTFVSNNSWNQMKINYINNRIGSNFQIQHLLSLKIFLNLYDILNQNRLKATRHQMITDALNEHFVGFISYDNSYSILRKIDDVELYKSVNKRYINYNIIDKFDDTKDFYVIPSKVNPEDINPVNIHIAEGVFDILSVFYNLNNCNTYQNIYIASAGKSYLQALNFILNETGLINYNIHIYPDNDVNDYELNKLVLNSINLLSANVYIHRNMCINEKDYGVPKDRIKDQVSVIYEKEI